MVTVQAIDENSPHLEAVEKLWRAHSATLGFMPAGAFADYAHERHILVTLNDNACVGYLLYRIVRERVTIAHFCVAPEARKQGVARAMLNHLIEGTRKFRGILLSCRRDFDAHDTWPRLGFHPIGEIVGRAAGGSVLVRWYLDYGHPDMFSGNSEPGALEAAIDANIFLDLIEQRSDETKGLQADWLRPFVELCYTAELLTEINRNEDAETRRKRAGEAQQFKMLRCTPEAMQKAEQVLRPLFPTFSSPQDESDFRHLARAVACEADAFVTRDGPLLDRADEIFEACSLSVVRPAELIARIDVIEHEREYQRSFVAGTREVFKERINCVNDGLTTAIQLHGEQRRSLAATLNRYLADPQRLSCHKIVGADGAPLAFFVVERDADTDRVPILRICAKRQAGTLARAVLTGLVRQAVQAGRKAVLVTDTLSDIIQSACSDLGFLSVQAGRLKLVCSGWLNVADVAAAIAWTDPKIDELRSALPSALTDAVTASGFEHLIHPGKLADSALPCFIVPIRRQYAEQLFDERLASGSFLGVDVDLALNPEAVYYRAARPFVLNCPARVLWYVSHNENYSGTMAIRACSRIVELARGTPKQLFPRFRRLGVFAWRDVLATADGEIDKEIMAFRFDGSELLRPVHWNEFQPILKRNGVNTNLESPCAIPANVFGEIYAAAFNPPQAR